MNSIGDNCTVGSLYASKVGLRTATDGSTLASPTAYNFAGTAPTITIPNGYYRYAFICYNSGSATGSWDIDFLTSYPNVASNYLIKVFSQNLWSTGSDQTTRNTYLTTRTASSSSGFNVQLNWEVISPNTQTSPVGSTQPLMVVVELTPYLS